MSASAHPPFTFSHHAWSAVRPTAPCPGVRLHRLRGGASEAWWVELSSGARFRAQGVPAELLLTVCSGRVTCLVLGNEIELPTGHYALIPPHLPVDIHVGGRSEATLLVSANAVLPMELPIE